MAAARLVHRRRATGTSSPAAWTWRPRCQGDAYRAFTDTGIPRDGGMADLLAEAASPIPKFAAVICEDIERSGRDTFNALKLEKKLSRNGIPLFATDEPAHIDGVNATTVLVRRMKQGVAEWFRLQLKEKTWKGLVEHSLDGWNIGTAPYGYTRGPDPAPRPGQSQPGPHQDPPGPGPGPRPGRGADLHLAHRRQARHADHRRPAQRRPGPLPRPRQRRLDHPGRVHAAAQPQVHRAHGLRAASASATAAASPPRPDQWLWSPEPTHPVIVDRATWDAAQHTGAEHGTSRDGTGLSRHPAAARIYPYRGRIRCRDCRRRMSGLRPGPRSAPVHLLPVPAQPGQAQRGRRVPRPPPHRQGPRDPPG